MMLRKRVAALFLTLAMLLSMAAVPASAAEIVAGDENKGTIYLSLSFTGDEAGTSSVSTVDSGKVFYGQIKFAGNPQAVDDSIQAYQLFLRYDSSKVEIRNALAASTALSKPEYNATYADNTAWVSGTQNGGFIDENYDIAASGTLCRVVFRAQTALTAEDLSEIQFVESVTSDDGKTAEFFLTDAHTNYFTVVQTPALGVTVDTAKALYTSATDAKVKEALTVKYIDDEGKESEVTDFEVTLPSGGLKAGANTITVTAKGLTAKAEINATAVTAESLSLTGTLDNDTYSSGDALDLTGLTVKVVYSDGEEVELTNGYDIYLVDSASDETGGTKLADDKKLVRSEADGKYIRIEKDGKSATCPTRLTVNKGPYSGNLTMDYEVLSNMGGNTATREESVDLTQLVSGKTDFIGVSYQLKAGSVSDSKDIIKDGAVTVTENGAATFTSNRVAANSTASFQVEVISTNYENVTATVTIKVTDKQAAEVSFSDVTGGAKTVTYNGAPQALTPVWPTEGEGDTTQTVTYAAEGGEASETAPTDAGVYTVTATYSNTTHYGTATAKLTISPKTVTVTASANATVSKTYDQTAAAGALSENALSLSGIIGSDDVKATANQIAPYADPDAGDKGNVAVTVGLTGAKAANYTLGGAETVNVKGVISKAVPTEIATVADTTIYADDAKNTQDAATLKSAMNLPTALSVTFMAGTAPATEEVAVTWSDTYTGAYNAKGGTYTFTGTLNGTNFSFPSSATAKLTVSPVTLSDVTASATEDLPKSINTSRDTVLKAASLEALGIPSKVLLAYTSDAGAGNKTAEMDATWDKTLADLQSAANRLSNSESNNSATVTMTLGGYPAWLTVPAEFKAAVSVNITYKFPVNVNWDTQITDTVYGTALATPKATATEIDGNGIGAENSMKYYYEGADDTTYARSETAPKDAGTYTVTAVWENDDHQGKSEPVTFKITPKPVKLTWNYTAAFTYDKTEKAVEATIAAADLVEGDTCTISAYESDAANKILNKATNAGKYTAKVKTLSNANYQPAEGSEQEWEILKADRKMTFGAAVAETPVTAIDITLYPKSTEAEGKFEIAYNDLDLSAKPVYNVAGDAATSLQIKGAKNGSAGSVAMKSGAANGAATIQISIPATANYNAAEAITIGVTIWPQVIDLENSTLSATLAGEEGGEDSKADLKATVDGSTFRVTGTMTEGSTVKYDEVRAINGLDVSVEGAKLLVKDGETVVAEYTIDTSSVAEVDTKTTITEKDTTVETAGVTDEEIKAATDAGKTNEVTGIAAAAAKKLYETISKDIDATSDSVEIDIGVTITPKTLDKNEKKYTLDIAPYYQVTTTKGGKEETDGPQLLRNEYIDSKVKIAVSVTLPDSLKDAAKVFVRHYKDAEKTQLIETLKADVADGVATWSQSSFSTVEIFADTEGKSGTVTFNKENGAVETVEYDLLDNGKKLPTDSKSGYYTFKGWIVSGDTSETPALYTEVNDAFWAALKDHGNALTLEPYFESYTPSHSGGSSGGGSSPATVKVSSTKNGKVTVDDRYAKTGETVTITVTPNKGYQVDEVIVTDKNGKNVKVSENKRGKFIFEQPKATPVTIEVTFERIPEEEPVSFYDVPDTYWAKDAIDWAYENGYMKGYTDTTFSPETAVTRQQLWMILARHYGANPGTMAEAREWAIASGVSDGSNPGTAMSRQQMVTILYRYGAMMGWPLTGSTDVASMFPDGTNVSGYAQEAISWAVANKIIQGTSSGTLNAAGTTSRAQFAVILMRFLKLVEG